MVVVEDAASIFAPEGRVAVRRAPAQVPAVQLRRVLVERRLRLRVLVQQRRQRPQVFERVWVRQVPRLDVRELRGYSCQHGDWEERLLVRGEQVEERGEEDARGFFFGRQAEELHVEDCDVVFAGGWVGLEG